MSRRINTRRYDGPLTQRTVKTAAQAKLTALSCPGEVLYVEESGAYLFWNGAKGQFVNALPGFVAIDAIPDDGGGDQTESVQRSLDACSPGQTAVLPAPRDSTNRYVRCGDIRIPSGVHLSTEGAIPIGWSVQFSPSLSQAMNTRISGVWFKQSKFKLYESGDGGTATSAAPSSLSDSSKSWNENQWAGWYVKITSGTGSSNIARPVIGNTFDTLSLSGVWGTVPDETSVYALFCNISACCLDNVQVDGTDTNNTGSTSGDAITVAEFGFDLKLSGNTQIWNYTGAGLAVYCNSDWVSNTGTPYLASGVFMCLSDVKIFNCEFGLKTIGSPQDGSSFHLSNVLIDHCTTGIHADNSVNGAPGTSAAGSGGITIVGSNLRTELCGSASTSQIYNNGGNISIFGLWQSSALTTAGHKVNWHRGGAFKAQGGRCTTGAAGVWAFLADPGQTGVFDVETNYGNNRVAGRESITASEDAGSELMTYRLRISKGATGVTVQCLSGSGFGWGLGSTAGDRVSSAVSAEITAGGASTNVGSNYTQVYFQMTAGGGSLQVTHAYKQFSKVLCAVIQKQTANINPLYVDAQLINGNANFNVIFTDATGAEMNIVAAMTTGQYVDVAVTVAALR